MSVYVKHEKHILRVSKEVLSSSACTLTHFHATLVSFSPRVVLHTASSVCLHFSSSLVSEIPSQFCFKTCDCWFFFHVYSTTCIFLPFLSHPFSFSFVCLISSNFLRMQEFLLLIRGVFCQGKKKSSFPLSQEAAFHSHPLFKFVLSNHLPWLEGNAQNHEEERQD